MLSFLLNLQAAAVSLFACFPLVLHQTHEAVARPLVGATLWVLFLKAWACMFSHQSDIV